MDEPPPVQDAEEIRATAEIHPEPVDKCLFCSAPRKNHGEFSCPHLKKGLTKLGLRTQEHIETTTFVIFPDILRRPTSRRKRKCITVSDCPACPRYVPHDLARCRFVQSSKWTEDGAKDDAQSPRQEPQRRLRPFTESPTWPDEFDVAPQLHKGGRNQSSCVPKRKGNAVRKAIESVGSRLMSKITILKRPASASKIRRLKC